MDFAERLHKLVEPLDPARHGVEIGRLQGCKSLQDLERIATHGGGWLNQEAREPRLKLVKHASGTYLVVQYEDGWSTRLAMQDFL
jgi:hypothetical protein